MAKYQILFWKGIPAQVKTMDEIEEFSVPFHSRFQEVIDEIAMREGLLDTDSYLNGWQWGEIQEAAGTAKEVAKKIAKDIDAKYPQQLDNFIELTQKQKTG